MISALEAHLGSNAYTVLYCIGQCCGAGGIEVVISYSILKCVLSGEINTIYFLLLLTCFISKYFTLHI